jgi:prepilin-type N-terminal cleavage/methylation domain-containing protein
MEQIMKMQEKNRKSGFTLVELMVSMAIGLVLLAAMASLFKTGMNATVLVQQRAQTQQDMRAAVDLMVKDISMAGAGLPSGGIQLPTGSGSSAVKFACDQTATCHVVNFDYPNANYMYGILPGYLNGVESGASIPAAPSGVNDSITVIYADYNYPLWEYNVTFTGTTGGGISVTPIAGFTPPALNAAGAIQQGDLIMLSNSLGTAVAEVTAAPTATTLTFANLDALNMNQSGAATNNVKAISTGASTVAYRLFAVTYYLSVPAAAGQTPRLMRQVNGLSPVPVADDIINLQFTYDVYNSTTDALDANEANPIGVGESPNNMQKINLLVMGQSITNMGNKSQNMYLATSVSARNMAFRNRYD